VEYDPAAYWSRVAEQVGARNEGDDWDLAGNSGPFDRYKRELTLSRLRDLPVSGRAVLELGPGPGGNLRALSAQRPSRLVGADVADGMLELALRNTDGLEVELVHLAGDDRLPFADREFDTSLAVTVLQHNRTDVAARLVKELARVTRSTLALIEDTTRWRRRRHQGSYFVRRADDYAGWATAEGFELVDATPMNVWVSERAWLLTHRMAALTRKQLFPEGAPVACFERRLQTFALKLTRRLDRWTPPLSGPTAMRFERRL
jgi:SAM-dependent methyltransferase